MIVARQSTETSQKTAAKQPQPGQARGRVTLLHTADLHLPSQRTSTRPPGLAGGDAFEALARVVDAANELTVDLVLFSGDLFDTYRPSKQVISFVFDQMERLEAPAVIIPGNHDCLDWCGVYHHSEWKRTWLRPYAITDPEGETLEVPGLPLLLWGKAMADHTPDFQPLAGLPQRSPDRWCVALGHGFLYPDDEAEGRSSPIQAHEISASGWDYIALGHKHVFQDVSQGNVRAAYAGSPVSAWNEKAQCLLVTLDDQRRNKVTIEPVDTAGVYP